MPAVVSGKNNGGCGFAIVAIIVIAIAVAVLRVVWWLLFILAAVLIVVAFSIRNRTSNKEEEAKQDDEPYYTQKCSNCGGQIKVSAYSDIALCQYCNSSFPAEHEPIEKPVEEKPKRFFYSPFQALIAFAVVLALLGCIGLGLSLTSNTSSDTSQNSSSTAIEASGDASSKEATS